MTGPKQATDAEIRLAKLEADLTQLKQALAQAIESFSPTAGRVTELSSAFQAANARLRGLETDMEQLKANVAENAPEARLAGIEFAISGMETRLQRVEGSRARGGRLSARLAGIEEKLDVLLPTEGGTDGDGSEDPPTGVEA